MEVSDVRRRLRGAIDDAKRRSAEHRARVDDATRAYEWFLTNIAIPAFQVLAQALVAEAHRFKVQTPGQTVRLVPDRASQDFIEFALDTERDTPAIVVRTARGRGRRMLSTERVIAEDLQIAELTDSEVIDILLHELAPFLEK
jgi:hypothetical protein